MSMFFATKPTQYPKKNFLDEGSPLLVLDKMECHE